MHTLAGTLTADHLPDTTWADQLRQADPDLALQLAVWRAATGAADHPYPLGPHASPTPDVRAQWQKFLAAHLPDHDLELIDEQLDDPPSRGRHERALRAAARDNGRARSIGR